eukprot:776221_1
MYSAGMPILLSELELYSIVDPNNTEAVSSNISGCEDFASHILNYNAFFYFLFLGVLLAWNIISPIFGIFACTCRRRSKVVPSTMQTFLAELESGRRFEYYRLCENEAYADAFVSPCHEVYPREEPLYKIDAAKNAQLGYAQQQMAPPPPQHRVIGTPHVDPDVTLEDLPKEIVIGNIHGPVQTPFGKTLEWIVFVSSHLDRRICKAISHVVYQIDQPVQLPVGVNPPSADLFEIHDAPFMFHQNGATPVNVQAAVFFHESTGREPVRISHMLDFSKEKPC